MNNLCTHSNVAKLSGYANYWYNYGYDYCWFRSWLVMGGLINYWCGARNTHQSARNNLKGETHCTQWYPQRPCPGYSACKRFVSTKAFSRSARAYCLGVFASMHVTSSDKRLLARAARRRRQFLRLPLHQTA